MPIVVVVGIQWGDEGKGKLIDFLASGASAVVRFQGGSNAGHTLVVDGKKTALRLIPSGILRPHIRCLLAGGVVLDPEVFITEVRDLKAAGVKINPERLGIAFESQLVLPYHKAIDQARENALAEDKIGTTGKGIGPCYEDAVSRRGVRIRDLASKALLENVIIRNVEEKNLILCDVLKSPERFEARKILSFLEQFQEEFGPYTTDVGDEVRRFRAAGECIIFEGAQAALLDIMHGTYPYVTSSHTLASYAPVSAGISPQSIDTIVGVAKAYCTRVGSGPFPTELEGDLGTELRRVGHEFGTVTGRPRRCGWFDAVLARKALTLNGVNAMFMTKLDILSAFQEVCIGVNYGSNGEVEYERIPGWKKDITRVRSYEELPSQAKRYLDRIQELTACKLLGFSVGPEREKTIIFPEYKAIFERTISV